MRNRINWKALLQELRQAGRGQQEIAVYSDTSQAAISRLSTGGTSDPAYAVGQKILELHRLTVLHPATQTIATSAEPAAVKLVCRESEGVVIGPEQRTHAPRQYQDPARDRRVHPDGVV